MVGWWFKGLPSLRSTDALSRVKPSPKSPPILVGIALALSFRVFYFYPGMAAVHDVWLVLAFLALLALYLPWRLRIREKLLPLEAYVLFLVLVMPVWSAVAAQRAFGQPLLYGILAQRAMVLIAAIPLLTWQALASGKTDWKNLERALLLMAWGSLALDTAMAVFLEPSAYFYAYGPAFASSADPADAKFVFNITFIVFGLFYYGFRGLRGGKGGDFARMGAFLLFCLFVTQGRSFLLALIGTFIWFGILWAPNRMRVASFLIKASIVAAVLGLAGYFFTHQLFVTVASKFADAFTVLFRGQMTDDASANARIGETLLALPWFLKHWIIGCGSISNQWQGGFPAVIEGYFYPVDIGILGALFTFGVSGTLLFVYQFKLAFGFSRNPGAGALGGRSLLDASKGFLVFYAVRSLATGDFAFAPGPSLFFLTLLMAASAGREPSTSRQGK